MGAARLDRMSDELGRLLAERLGARGHTLKERLRSAGRLVPRRLRRVGQKLVEAETLAAHPRLARQIDMAELERGQADFVRWLRGIDRAEARLTALLRFLAAMVINVAIIAALVIWFIRAQGLM